MPPKKNTLKAKVKEVEVDEEVVKKGTIRFMNEAAFVNPAPARMKVVIKALLYFCTAFNGLVASTNLFTGTQTKVIVFITSVFVLALGAIEMATGVEPAPAGKKE